MPPESGALRNRGENLDTLTFCLRPGKGQDVRRSSALKLGQFHELAKDAIPALQKAKQQDSDPRVREAAGIALSRIDPVGLFGDPGHGSTPRK